MQLAGSQLMLPDPPTNIFSAPVPLTIRKWYLCISYQIAISGTFHDFYGVQKIFKNYHKMIE